MRRSALISIAAALLAFATGAQAADPPQGRRIVKDTVAKARVHAPAAGDCYPDEIMPVLSSPHAPARLRPGPVPLHGPVAFIDQEGLRRVWQVTRDGWGRILGCWVTVPLDVVTHDRGVMRQLTLHGYSRPPVIAGSLARSELARPGYPDAQLFPPDFLPAVPGATNRAVVLDPQGANWQRRYYPY